jgi:phenylalanyl-tRNA synthetase beta chain
MQVSLRWLKDYVDIEVAPETLAQKLTMAGLEVEAVERRQPAFSGVVVAKILAKKQHPNADKLSLCDVTDGANVYSVVCGAPNILSGDIVPLAKTGALLQGGETIKETRIRGELSVGMLCSEVELGISSEASGVMILWRPSGGESLDGCSFATSEVDKKPLTLGEELSSALDLQDIIFNIGITPNRPDCLSVIGIAREIAALTGKKLKLPGTALEENEEKVEQLTSVTVDDPDLCPRYSARIVKNIEIKPSPLWMRLRLEGAGMRAISNIVDITNFVMLEMGQPLHAFDYRYLAEGRIVVRRSRAGEVFTTLDGKERALKPDMLLICDGVKPVAIGGVMGGINSEINDDTKTILLESAYFDPVSIRTSAKWLGMSTDAAFRFERGIDPEGVIEAQNRAACLMAKLSSGTICRGIIDCYPSQVKTAANIPLRVRRVGEIVGAEIKADEIVTALESLEMTVLKDDQAGHAYLVTPPTFRRDIEREIDLIEEIVRIRGYESIPATLPFVALEPIRRGKKKIVEDMIRGNLTGNGYSEVITYSFVSPQWTRRLGIEEGDDRSRLVHIKNPLTEDQSVMRTTLLCGLLETMKRNVRLSSFDLKIFETGKVFIAQGKDELPRERNHLGCLLTGIQDEDSWQSKKVADYYDLKGCAESILASLRIGAVKFSSGTREPFLHPGKSSGIMVGSRYAGFLGELHGDVLEAFDLNNTAFVMEVDLDVITDVFSSQISFREVSRFPAINRDVALLVTKQIEADRVLSLVREESEELLEKVCIFDIYEGKGVSEGLRSLGLRFTYRSPEKTLTDDEITGIHSRIVERVISATGACIRG